MKVCIVTHKLVLTDGQGRINYEVARYLAMQGHNVTLVASEVDSALAATPRVEWRRVIVPRGLPTAFLRYQWFALGSLAAILPDRNRFDIIQVNGAITLGAADINVAMFVHSNWSKSPHHPSRVHRNLYGIYQRFFTQFNATWERRAFRAATRVVALSEPVRDSLVKDVGLEQGRIATIEPGVDPDEFRPLRPGEPNHLRQTIGVGSEAYLLFFAGDIRSNRKNLDLVLSALVEFESDVHLVVVGNALGSPYPELARRLALSARVHFLGHRNDVPLLLRGADVFVFPSHYDTFALVVAEAMASGVITITAAQVGAASLVHDGQTGFLLQHSTDRAGLIRSVRALRADRAMAEKMRSAGREAASRRTWHEMGMKYEALFSRVLALKRNTRRHRWWNPSVLPE